VADDVDNDDDMSLGELPVVESTTPPIGPPADFDLDAWLSGVRHTRRSVKLFGRADGLARMEQIAELVEASPEDDNVDALVDEFEVLQRNIRDSGVWFTVEGRSSEWVRHFRDTTAETLGVKLTSDSDAPANHDRVLVLLHQLADQIVEPAITVKQLQKLLDTSEGELNKLVVAMRFANDQLPESAEVLTLDFSSRRSGRKGTTSRR